MPDLINNKGTNSSASGRLQRNFFSAGVRDVNKLAIVLLFVPPAVLLFTLFVVLPIIDAGYYAFFKWNGYGEPTNYVGLKNFSKVLDHRVFETTLWNALKIIGVSLLIQIPLAMSLALLLAEKTRLNYAFRLIFFLPFILAEVVAGLIWRFVYDGEYGIAAEVAKMTGTEPVFVLAERQYAFYAILFVMVWKYFGYHMMIFIAGLQSISKDLIEAAQLEGANPLQIARSIKIPLLAPAIKLSLFFSILGSFQVYEIIAPLTNGGPNHSTHTIVSFLYTFGITRMKVGFGSATGLILFAICVAFAFTYQRKVMKNNG